MKKSLLTITVFIFAFSLFSIPGFAAITPSADAAKSGYHEILYTRAMMPAETGNANNNILGNLYVSWEGIYLGDVSPPLGGNPTLSITGTGTGNYEFRTAAGKSITIPNALVANGGFSANSITSNGAISSQGPISSSGTISASGGITANGALTGGSIAVTSKTVVNNNGDWVGNPIPSSSVSGDVVAGTCGAGEVVTGTTTSGVSCTPLKVKAADVTDVTLTAGQTVAAVGTCPAGKYVASTTSAGVTCLDLPAASADTWTTSGTNQYSALGGNVGVGTASPGTKLDVAGDIRSSGTVSGGTVSATTVSGTNVNAGTLTATSISATTISPSTISFGSVSGCSGSATSCYSYYDAASCSTQEGCGGYCGGGTIYRYCSSFSNYDDCDSQSYGNCWWDWGSNSCSGTWSDSIDCSNYNWDSSTCSSMGCYWQCQGNPNACSSYSDSSSCNAQSGCSYTTSQRTISASGTGIAVSQVKSDTYCNAAGTACFKAQAAGTVAATHDDGSAYNAHNIRVGTQVNCPGGYYLSGVRVDDGPGNNGAMLTGTCTKLPVSR